MKIYSIKKYYLILLNSGLPVVMMALPLVSGISTSQLIILLVLAAITLSLYSQKLYLSNSYILVFTFYTILACLFYFQYLIDTKNLLQLITSYLFLLTMMLLRGRATEIICIIPIASFIVLGFLNYSELILAPFIGLSRIDVLNWQDDTGFFFGINRFLLAIFILVTVLIASGKRGSVWMQIITFFYFVYAFLLGSRTHSLLSILLFLITIFYASKKNRLIGIFYIILLASFVYYFYDLIGIIFEINIQHRFEQGFEDPGDTPRGIIFNNTVACINDSNYLYGNEIWKCVRSLGTSDFDNTFLFVFGAGGIMTLLIFFLMQFVNIFILFSSHIKNLEKVYILIGYILILSSDVVLFKAFIFLPLLIYHISTKRNIFESKAFAKYLPRQSAT